MIIGVAKEIKNNEFRVGMTPSGAEEMRRAGHAVLIEAGAGAGSGFSDAAYEAAGAEVLADKRALFDRAEMIVKVKEPLASEYDLLHAGQILFTYLHLAAEPELAAALLRKKVIGIAYETVRGPHGAGLPLLAPMSEIAGRMSVQIGAHFLESHSGGSGVLLGGIAGVPAGQVVIIGGGNVGTNAARIAVGLGARVTIIDRAVDRLRYLDELFGGRVVTAYSTRADIARWVRTADLLIGSVLVPGGRTPILVTEDMVRTMKKGSVIVDVAIDQGGSIETCDHVTTHDTPTFEKHGVIHYAVANIPGAVSRTATLGITNATLPYVRAIAAQGCKAALRDVPGFRSGLNTIDGHLTNRAVSEALALPCADIDAFL